MDIAAEMRSRFHAPRHAMRRSPQVGLPTAGVQADVMYTWQPKTLCWSFSRSREFSECPRSHFFDRFWGQDPNTSYDIYKLRMLTTLPALRGSVVHMVIAEMLRSVREGSPLSLEEAKERVTTVLRERYMESAKRLWHKNNRPPGRKMHEFTSLFEHYYKTPNVVEQARDARRIAWTCLENLAGSDFWNRLTQSDPSAWIEIEDAEFHSFDLDGIQVYARPDFAQSGSSPTIVDWKTGEPSDQDRRQLVVYSLYARFRWDWDPLNTTLSAVYLHPDFHVHSFTPTADDIQAAKSLIKEGFERMLELEPTVGPAKMETFPMSRDLHRCRWCRFQEVCVGARRQSES